MVRTYEQEHKQNICHNAQVYEQPNKSAKNLRNFSLFIRHFYKIHCNLTNSMYINCLNFNEQYAILITTVYNRIKHIISIHKSLAKFEVSSRSIVTYMHIGSTINSLVFDSYHDPLYKMNTII